MFKKPYYAIDSNFSFESSPIKGSRFIGYLFPIQSDADVKTKVSCLWAQHAHARHCCWAMQTLYSARCDDDGEPRFSAGKPILAQIQGAELFNVGLVVVRYFGGTKLGVGGLVRAYSSCAGDLVKQADFITVTPKTAVKIIYLYSDTSSVNAVLAQFKVNGSDVEYGSNISQLVLIEDSQVDVFIFSLKERSAGRVHVGRVDNSSNL